VSISWKSDREACAKLNPAAYEFRSWQAGAVASNLQNRGDGIFSSSGPLNPLWLRPSAEATLERQDKPTQASTPCAQPDADTNMIKER